MPDSAMYKSTSSAAIKVELDRELITKSLTAAPGFFLCAAWVAYNRFGSLAHSKLILSLGILLMILSVMRYKVGSKIKKNDSGLPAAGKILKANILLNGLIWGLVVLLPVLEFGFGNAASSIQVIALILGLTLSSIMTLGTSLLTAYAFQWMLTLPTCIYLFYIGINEKNSVAMNAAIIILIAILYMLQQTHQAHKQIVKRLRALLDLETSNNRLKFVKTKLKSLNEELESKVAERTSELSEAKQAAESANHAKSEFLANMSHEIRTPLGAVMGFAELVSNYDISPSEKQNYVAAIKRNGELLSNIISDILDLSKIEVGKLHLEYQDVTLSEIISDSETLLHLVANEKAIKLTFDMDNGVPATIRTDPLRLKQVLLNIVGNSLKFTEQGSVTVTLKMTEEPNGVAKLNIVVKDTGIGISEEQAQKLFQAFTQADNSMVRKFGGTGLGLILSKRLAKLLGGDVTLSESKLGSGTTFVITIDPGLATDTKLPKRSTYRKAVPLQALEGRLDNLNILIVDDSIDNQFLISKILRMSGALISTAENGKIALDMAAKHKYDLILLDLQMPVMDGYDTATRLRQNGIHTPIIALTAYALKEIRQRCLDCGFDDFLTKPVNRSLLVEKISRFIDHSH